MVDIKLIVLAIYLLLMFGVAWYFSRKESLEAYFINKKSSGLWLLTFSSVSTMIGAGATVAMVSEVYNTGISYGIAIPISLVIGAILLGLIAKRTKELGNEYEAYTLVDFFHKRFDTKNKILVFFIQIFLHITWMGVQAIAMASLASVLIGIDYNLALFLTVGITILYTTMCGLKVDLITDFIQFWIILITFIIMGIVGYKKIGGFSNLVSNLPQGHLNPFAFGGVVWFLGAIFLSGFVTLGSSWSWQRTVSAKNEIVAKKSLFLAIPFILLISVITIFFGLLATILLDNINKDLALFKLIETLLPPSLVGLVFAAILAVLMSTIDSLLVAGSTIMYRIMFKKDQFENKKQIFYARLITALFGICGFSLAYLFPNIVSLSLFSAYLAIVFAIPMLFGMYSKKLSSNSSFYAILLSFIILLISFPIIGPNSFVPPLITSLLILIFYDKIFKKNITVLE